MINLDSVKAQQQGQSQAQYLRDQTDSRAGASIAIPHNLSNIEDALANAIEQVDQLCARANMVADALLGGEPPAGENGKCSPISIGRIGCLEDRLTRLQYLLVILAHAMDRIELAVQ